MSLGLLVALENANKHTHTQDSCFISIDLPNDHEAILCLPHMLAQVVLVKSIYRLVHAFVGWRCNILRSHSVSVDVHISPNLK